MFQPDIFKERSVPAMHALMRAHPFATLVTTLDGRPEVDHVPLVLHPEGGKCGVLRGHLARGNPLARSEGTKPEASEPEALAVFQGPQAYVSPSWYASKREHGKVVPTWNYACVHARGTLRLVRDGEWLMQHLRDLSAQHEAHRTQPWAVEDAPADFVTRMLRGLVGFEIAIGSLEGTWKVSQNKNRADRTGVVDGLRESDNTAAVAMSRLVGERQPPL